MGDQYPPVAFYFGVTFAGENGLSGTSFQEVSGIDLEIDVETYVEGGENRFVHNLPKRVKHSNLVLKRGIATATSPLVRWCQTVFENEFAKPIEPRGLMVTLLNEQNIPIITWSVENAFPVKWSIDSFNSTKNEVAIETIELSYSYFTRVA